MSRVEMLKMYFQDCVAGAGYLEHYGSHPGNIILIGGVLLGALVGTERGWLGSVVGATAILAVFGIPWLIGAHDRGRGQRIRDQG